MTDRGKPVARITALTGAANDDERIAELVRCGKLQPPRKKLPRDFLKRPLPADPEGLLSSALEKERAESW